MIYRNIKRLCAEKNISISQLEKKLNFSNGAISKWDKSNPSAISVRRVANYLNVSMEELLNEDGD